MYINEDNVPCELEFTDLEILTALKAVKFIYIFSKDLKIT